MKLRLLPAMLAASVCAAAATAAPITLNLNGSVSSASGAWAGAEGTGFSAALTFDLDPNNAVVIEDIENEFEERRWIFQGGSYGLTFTPDAGSPLDFLSVDTIAVETINNIDLDGIGNPFGLTGIRDVLSFTAGNVIADCLPSEQNAAGFCPPESANENGTDYDFFIVGADNWFADGVTLPSVFPDLSSGYDIAGSGVRFTNNAETANAEFTFDSPAPVPLPAGVWLMLSAVGATALIRRKGRAAA
ncbi:MAG: VPLPA-CTERM sorting domain-containing protein [Pseudomonadota bacterium]